jgi:hypothetical protein
MKPNPAFILYAQHGWADTSHTMAKLAHVLATPETLVITPNLGWVDTWLRIEPLIQRLERIVTASLERYPDARVRVIGHSMGGLIWLELLARHPPWWSRVESVVLVAAPVGGADLARILDPIQLGIGIARDLGVDRRPLAEMLAQHIPLLSIAGDVDHGSDGTITIGTTQFRHAKTLTLAGLSHAAMRNHPAVGQAIQRFWSGEALPDTLSTIIQLLRAVPGMTDAHHRDFRWAKVCRTLNDGSTIRTWKNPVQIEHVFVADRQGRCLFGGFVGWMDASSLQTTIELIQQRYR